MHKSGGPDQAQSPAAPDERIRSVLRADTVSCPGRQAVFITLLWFTCTVVLSFAVMHMYLGARWLAAAELGLVIYAAVLLVANRESGRARSDRLIFAVAFLGVSLGGLASTYNDMSVFVWVLLMPMLTPLLLGRRRGALAALVFMGSAALIFAWRYQPPLGPFGFMALANVVACTAAMFAFSYVYEVSRERSEVALRQLASIDPLTRLANRFRFREVFGAERERYLRQGTPLSMLVVDIDRFKQVNDDFGHDAGDMALCFIADTLSSRIRQTDVAARLGGEEFGILLSGADRDYALKVARMLGERIMARPYRYHGQNIPMSVSIGVAELGTDGMDFRTLFSKADSRLYQAKAEGRNRVVG